MPFTARRNQKSENGDLKWKIISSVLDVQNYFKDKQELTGL